MFSESLHLSYKQFYEVLNTSKVPSSNPSIILVASYHLIYVLNKLRDKNELLSH